MFGIQYDGMRIVRIYIGYGINKQYLGQRLIKHKKTILNDSWIGIHTIEDDLQLRSAFYELDGMRSNICRIWFVTGRTANNPIKQVKQSENQWKKFSWELINPKTFATWLNTIPIHHFWSITLKIIEWQLWMIFSVTAAKSLPLRTKLWVTL